MERATIQGNVVHIIIYLRLDASELLPGSVELGVGLSEGDTLGLHIAVHLVVGHDVDDPRTQTGGGERLGPDELGLELGVGQIRLHGFAAVLVDVVLVVVQQVVQELVNLRPQKKEEVP